MNQIVVLNRQIICKNRYLSRNILLALKNLSKDRSNIILLQLSNGRSKLLFDYKKNIKVDEAILENLIISDYCLAFLTKF